MKLIFDFFTYQVIYLSYLSYMSHISSLSNLSLFSLIPGGPSDDRCQHLDDEDSQQQGRGHPEVILQQ